MLLNHRLNRERHVREGVEVCDDLDVLRVDLGLEAAQRLFDRCLGAVGGGL